MSELQVALIAIALVLSAVFLPMAFFGGSTGVIYRQFSLTIISAMVLSVLVALILSPAITASVLKPQETAQDRRRSAAAGPPRGAGNAASGCAATGSTAPSPRRSWRYLGAVRYGGRPQVAVSRHLCAGAGVCWWCCSCVCPAAFCRTRIRGGSWSSFGFRPARPRRERSRCATQIEEYFRANEASNVDSIFPCGRRGRPAVRVGAEYRAGLHQPQALGRAAGQRKTPPMRLPSGPPRRCADLRDAQVFTLVPGVDPRAGRQRRLHHAVAEHRAG